MSTSARPSAAGTAWRNWSGLEEAVPRHVETPGSVASVVEAVRRAREGGTTVKMTGTGHSFTAIATPEHTLLRPEALTGILAVDRDAGHLCGRGHVSDGFHRERD